MTEIQDQTPPQNLEAEESVLGAMMVSEIAIDPVIVDVRLADEDFYRDRHRVIFRAVKHLVDKGKPVDAISVTELLTQHGELEEAGGREVVSSLASTVPAAGNARHYAEIVKQNALLRRLLRASHEIEQSVRQREGEPRELVERAEALLFKVANQELASDFRSVREVLTEELRRLEQLQRGDLEMTGTRSGFADLDNVTGGFQPGNLVIVAARPAMGKSSLVCNIAENVALKEQKPVAFFSLEMSEAELAHRFIASQAGVSNDKLRKGKVAARDWQKVVRASAALEESPLWLDDSSDLSMLELRAKARRLAASTGGLGLVIVDYMQLMRAEDPRVNRVEQVGQISRGLKILARELKTPVLGLSQLSRAPELRTGDQQGVPMLSDLRESGCLTGDTRVFLPDEGSYARIEDLEGRDGFRVLGVDSETWRLEPRRVTRAFSTGRKPVLRLRTQLGREIRATANHKFLALDGWHRLDELEVGARIALPRSLPEPRREASMSDAELALLAHLIGDGCTLPRHAIQYTTNDRSLADLVVGFASELFGSAVRPRIHEETPKGRKSTWFQVFLASAERLARGRRNPVAEWLAGLGAFGLRSHEKLVPAAVFEQPDEAVALFLRHLWATDGCVWISRRGHAIPRVYYATTSRRLAAEVQSLLLRLGINARQTMSRSSAARDQIKVQISGAPDIKCFLERVGGLGNDRPGHADAILKHLEGRAENTNRDVVPREAWTLMVKPALAGGMTTRKLQAGLGMAYCGSTLYRSAMSRERAGRVAEVLELPALSRLATSDLYWDRIASIEPEGEEEVFDLTVEGLNSFVADDIVVHNSIEQDADVVIFIYRPAVYHEDADPGEADLIVAKHRNGPTGEVPLVFIDKYPKFANRSWRKDAPRSDAGGDEESALAAASDEG